MNKVYALVAAVPLTLFFVGMEGALIAATPPQPAVKPSAPGQKKSTAAQTGICRWRNQADPARWQI